MKRLLLTLLFCLPLAEGQADPLRIGTLLIEDVVPIYAAEADGLFQAEGVDVELVPFLSALERDSALTAGAIDGAIDDPVGALTLDRGRGLIKITSLCLGATPGEGVFAILAAPGSRLTSVADLAGVPVAVSNGTIIEYVTQRLLKEAGLAPGAIQTIEIKKMPIRMQMLLAGEVLAATLPEPLASIAVGKGARVLISDADSATSLSQTVLVFRTPVLTERRGEVAAFFRAYAQAVQAIAANPEQYRPLLIDKGRIPPSLAAAYPIPAYPTPEPYSRVLYQPVIDWLVGQDLVPRLEYAQMVATDFLEPAP